MILKTKLLLPALLLIAAVFARGEVTLSPLFSDGAILQRNTVVPVWGAATPGKDVTVSLGSQKKTTTVAPDGNWMVKLDPMETSSNPATMTVSDGVSTNSINDILIGEVWIASGQSNMDFPLDRTETAAAELAASTDNHLRFFQIPKQTSDKPEQRIPGAQWVAASPETAKPFSAVAYFFAKEIRKDQACPVGIIQASWGGTRIECWTGLEGLKNPPPIEEAVAAWDHAVARHEKVSANPKIEEDYQAALASWKEAEKAMRSVQDAAMKLYSSELAAGIDPGAKPTMLPPPQNPDPMGIPSQLKPPQIPCVLFNGMIHPAIPYALRGAIWYQGEQNSSQGLQYRELLPRLISNWRSQWGSDFPFLIVQLPAFGKDSEPVAEKGWPWLREAQLRTLSVPKTGLAVTIDVGDPNDVHPRHKLTVGKRLALLAFRDVYEKKIEASGPLYDGFKIEGDKILVSFKETAKGLTLGSSPWSAKGVDPLPTDRLIGFYIAGEDRKWIEADAAIAGSNNVVVSGKSLTNPVAVRYGWAQSPRCNLYNSEGLPASPFRTDSWDPTPPSNVQTNK